MLWEGGRRRPPLVTAHAPFVTVVTPCPSPFVSAGMLVSADRIVTFLRAEEFQENLVIKDRNGYLTNANKARRGKGRSGGDGGGGGGGGGVREDGYFRYIDRPQHGYGYTGDGRGRAGGTRGGASGGGTPSVVASIDDGQFYWPNPVREFCLCLPPSISLSPTTSNPLESTRAPTKTTAV